MVESNEALGLADTQGQVTAYEPPLLRKFGDIRALTLGNSVDVGDSGAGSLQRF